MQLLSLLFPSQTVLLLLLPPYVHSSPETVLKAPKRVLGPDRERCCWENLEKKRTHPNIAGEGKLARPQAHTS